MKFLFAVLLSTILGVVFSRTFTQDQYFPHAKECIAELGINDNTILENFNEDLTGIEGNADLINLNECLLRKWDAIDENNLIKFDVIEPLLVRYVKIVNTDNAIIDAQQATHDALQSCKDVQANGAGNQLVKIWNCFVKYVK